MQGTCTIIGLFSQYKKEEGPEGVTWNQFDYRSGRKFQMTLEWERNLQKEHDIVGEAKERKEIKETPIHDLRPWSTIYKVYPSRKVVLILPVHPFLT